MTRAELSSINRIAKETKTLEGFENELERINEEYQEAGRIYRNQLGEGRPSVSEVSEGIEVYKAEARPEEVIPPQKLHPELREPQSEFGKEPTSAETQNEIFLCVISASIRNFLCF